jgi:fluoroacetyl-CoA thioesterase
LKPSLKPGIESEFRYKVPANKTVPALYPEAAEFQQMPEVFATGFLVGLLEWACVDAINPHLDWPSEQTLGTHIDVSHAAATPPGFAVTVKVKLVRVDGRKLFFEVEASDGVHVISKGTHERFVIDRARFVDSVARKAAAAGA